jgi:hypothetical protein
LKSFYHVEGTTIPSPSMGDVQYMYFSGPMKVIIEKIGYLKNTFLTSLCPLHLGPFSNLNNSVSLKQYAAILKDLNSRA